MIYSDTQSEQVFWMQQALALAARGRYTTRPNPMVGCVIVKNGHKVGEGWHQYAGQPHAEVYALRQAGLAAQGATAYVTLEPCAHQGRTPPCADALIAAGITEVVVACLDPNPLVAGQGIARLEAAGIKCHHGILEAEAKQLNAGFLRAITGGLPWVRLKMAISLDGRVAMANGESKWITSSQARQAVQQDRARAGAIITGSGTVLADDPQLNVRKLADLPEGISLENIPQPLRVVLDRRGRLTGHHWQLMQQPAGLIICGPMPIEPVAQVTYWPSQALSALLLKLAQEQQVREVLVEAGSHLATAFLQENLVDELIIYQAPVLLGSSAQPMTQLQIAHLAERLQFECVDQQPCGLDLRLVLRRVT